MKNPMDDAMAPPRYSRSKGPAESRKRRRHRPDSRSSLSSSFVRSRSTRSWSGSPVPGPVALSVLGHPSCARATERDSGEQTPRQRSGRSTAETGEQPGRGDTAAGTGVDKSPSAIDSKAPMWGSSRASSRGASRPTTSESPREAPALNAPALNLEDVKESPRGGPDVSESPRGGPEGQSQQVLGAAPAVSS